MIQWVTHGSLPASLPSGASLGPGHLAPPHGGWASLLASKAFPYLFQASLFGGRSGAPIPQALLLGHAYCFTRPGGPCLRPREAAMSRPDIPPDHAALDVYLAEIRRIPLLTVEEEQSLARRFREGDHRAGHQLVAANLRFVVKVAFEYRSYGLKMPDVIQEGNIGLMRAVQKFDPDKKVRLISYAVWWIRAYIQNHILRTWSLVKLGTTQAQRKLFFSLSRTRRELQRTSSGPGDAEAIALSLSVKTSEVEEMAMRLERRDHSLDQTWGDRDGDTHGDRLGPIRPRPRTR